MWISYYFCAIQNDVSTPKRIVNEFCKIRYWKLFSYNIHYTCKVISTEINIWTLERMSQCLNTITKYSVHNAVRKRKRILSLRPFFTHKNYSTFMFCVDKKYKMEFSLLFVTLGCCLVLYYKKRWYNGFLFNCNKYDLKYVMKMIRHLLQ